MNNTLLKFYASWCAPCTALSATLHGVNHKLVKTMRDVSIETTEGLDLAKRYNVTTIPTMIIIDEHGMEIRRLNGNRGKREVVDFLA